MLFPGSALARKQPAAVMSAELVETSRLFARMNAAIDPAWAESIAGDLVKRSYGEPHWEKRQGAAVAIERVTLYGVPSSSIDGCSSRESIPLTRANCSFGTPSSRANGTPIASTRGWRPSTGTTAPFGRSLPGSRSEPAAATSSMTTRRSSISTMPASRARVATTRSFETWWRAARETTPELLTLTREVLAGETEIDEGAFPATWRQGDQTLALAYRFEPGAEDDGVTVRVPLALLAALSPAGFDWLVPGCGRSS